MRDVASAHNLESFIHLRFELLSAEWLANKKIWMTKFLDHNSNNISWRRCRALITAVGFLDLPRGSEEIVGIEAFSGTVLHVSNWSWSVDFTDKNVFVVGNGGSANQLIPWLVENTKLRSLIQVIRSAQWIVPKENYVVTDMQKW